MIRNGKEYIASNFSAQLKKHQASWLPCEIESLAVTAAVNHFATDVVNSNHQTLILTDSLPSVQAFAKLQRGQFSSSARVSTFLSTLSRYNVHLSHLKGKENIYSDYVSRNAVQCDQKRCQICTYIAEVGESVVRACTVKEVLDSTCSVPFSSRSGWHEMQVSDDSLRRACAHLKQGTTPSRKSTNIHDVKRYLQVARISRDGLLIVLSHSPMIGKVEKIVVPRDYLHGLLECLHLKLQHPSKSQLRQVFNRAYYALGLDDALDAVMKNCHACLALSDMPNKFMKQSMTTQPESVGSNFSADVVRRSGQPILFLREYVSSYSQAKLVHDEKASTLRDALIIMAGELVPQSGPKATVKVDPASSCRSLASDSELARHGMVLELGHPKFKNKNPVGERGIRELHSELSRIDGQLISEKDLATAVATLNSRIRREGLSSWEMWTHRCQFTGSQLPLDDLLLIRSQESRKRKSHAGSSKFKARGKSASTVIPIQRGDLVYINSDRDKLKARERYVVKDVGDETCKVQKFTGLQLRARTYTVNRADVLKVSPWKFPDLEVQSEDDEEDSTVVGRQGIQTTDADGDGDDSEEDSAGSEQDAPVGNVEVTRSGRRVRPPSRFKDFVKH